MGDINPAGTEKAMVVLEQDEVDTLIHALDSEAMQLPEDEFQEWYGDIYQKLMAVMQDTGSEYQVK